MNIIFHSNKTGFQWLLKSIYQISQFHEDQEWNRSVPLEGHQGCEEQTNPREKVMKLCMGNDNVSNDS